MNGVALIALITGAFGAMATALLAVRQVMRELRQRWIGEAQNSMAVEKNTIAVNELMGSMRAVEDNTRAIRELQSAIGELTLRVNMMERKSGA